MDFQKPGSGHLEGLSGVAKSSFLGGVWVYHLYTLTTIFRPYYLGLFLFNGLVETCSRCIESVLPNSILLSPPDLYVSSVCWKLRPCFSLSLLRSPPPACLCVSMLVSSMLLCLLICSLVRHDIWLDVCPDVCLGICFDDCLFRCK